MNNVTSLSKPTQQSLSLSVQRAVQAKGAPLRPQIVQLIRLALERPAEITLRFVGEVEGFSLNQTFRHQNHATNVLSFPYTQYPIITGDLVLCVPVVEREAQEQLKSVTAHYMHLIIHGVLHLHGYDHDTEEHAVQMEALETQFLTGLGFANPYVVTE